MTTRSATSASDAAYFNETQSWETHRVHQLVRSARVAWIVAFGFALLACLATASVAMLTPLKTVEPYVVRVDNAAGTVDIVDTVRESTSGRDETLNKFFLQRYIQLREGYSKDLAEENYYGTGLMSGEQEQQRYSDSFSPKNPQSPLNIYGNTARVRVTIKSTSFIQPNIALVRYSKEVERAGDKAKPTHWAATVTFRYANAPMKERDRAINPLGFQVTEFRADPDAVVDLTPDAAQQQPTANQIAPAGIPVTLQPGERVNVPVPQSRVPSGFPTVPEIR